MVSTDDQMSKLDEIRADLGTLDLMTIASAEKQALVYNVQLHEKACEEANDRLRIVVKALDEYEKTEAPRNEAAARAAQALVQKYGKPIATLRKILKDIEG